MAQRTLLLAVLSLLLALLLFFVLMSSFLENHQWANRSKIQGNVSDLVDAASTTFYNASLTVNTTYDVSLTVNTPNSSLHCSASVRLATASVCKQVGHRQKRPVRLAYAPGSWMASDTDLGEHSCPTTRCVSSVQTEEADVIVAEVRDAASAHKDAKGKVLVVLAMESSVNYPQLLSPQTYGGTDVVVASHRRFIEDNPWVPVSYVNADLETFVHVRGAEFSERVLALPLFMSNCGAAQRLRAIESLVQQGSVEVHAFGACVPEGVQRGELALEYPECFGQPRRSAMWDAQKECVLFRAMFSLDLENSLENGYITEKVYLYLYLYLSICSV